MIYVGFLLFILSGMFEAVMDKLQFHYDLSIFKKFKNQLFWDPKISWKNKYEDGDPMKGERFFLSKSLFVGITDAWHLFKLFRTLTIFAGIYFLFIPCATKYTCLMFVIIARILFGLSFTLFFKIFED
jgi:hypothetical protein